jgi:hypothetical protein
MCSSEMPSGGNISGRANPPPGGNRALGRYAVADTSLDHPAIGHNESQALFIAMDAGGSMDSRPNCELRGNRPPGAPSVRLGQMQIGRSRPRQRLRPFYLARTASGGFARVGQSLEFYTADLSHFPLQMQQRGDDAVVIILSSPGFHRADIRHSRSTAARPR